MGANTVYIALGVLVLLIAVLVYLRWNSSSPAEEFEEESLPDDDNVAVDDEDEEFTIIDNQ